MSKRELKGYLKDLTKEQLEDQITDLYTRFKEVKEFYDFAFHPQEDKLMEQCRFQIGKEYFPLNGRRPKARRSVAQKWIRKLKLLGAESSLIADVMLYNIEIAQAWAGEKTVSQESFFRSMLKSFEEALEFISVNGLLPEFSARIEKLVDQIYSQAWSNRELFGRLADKYSVY